MHYLHAILVEIEEDVDKEKNYSPDEISEIEDSAREKAMSETEQYADSVFDWRTDSDAGRWSESFPGKGVVLGLTEPERFFELLIEHSNMPLEEALVSFQHSKYANTKWRSKLEIDENPQIEIIPNDNNGSVSREGVSTYYSGFKNETQQITEEFITKLWNSNYSSMDLYSLTKAIKAASGEYMTDSCFYSVPDGSVKLTAELKETITENFEKYALVFSDYHN